MVGTAPTAEVTVDVNLNAVSFLTLTIPANDIQSDMTWVIPPLFIGQKTGQAFVPADEITVTQTAMQDAADGLTVYLYVYLPDGT